jgi:hypothetical protein
MRTILLLQKVLQEKVTLLSCQWRSRSYTLTLLHIALRKNEVAIAAVAIRVVGVSRHSKIKSTIV